MGKYPPVDIGVALITVHSGPLGSAKFLPSCAVLGALCWSRGILQRREGIMKTLLVADPRAEKEIIIGNKEQLLSQQAFSNLPTSTARVRELRQDR